MPNWQPRRKRTACANAAMSARVAQPSRAAISDCGPRRPCRSCADVTCRGKRLRREAFRLCQRTDWRPCRSAIRRHEQSTLQLTRSSPERGCQLRPGSQQRQPTPSPAATSRGQFHQAVGAQADGHWSAAVSNFRRSQSMRATRVHKPINAHITNAERATAKDSDRKSVV